MLGRHTLIHPCIVWARVSVSGTLGFLPSAGGSMLGT
jgi:hypothetical protein